MNSVKVRNIEIGTGIPKICVPIVGTSQEEILRAAKEIKKLSVDVVEWRVDWYEDVSDFGKVKETLKGLRTILDEMPLLFTFRTSKEGGEKTITEEDYIKLNQEAARTGSVDLVDVEMFTGDEAVRQIVEAAHECGVKVIMSNHDFQKTPDQQEIVSRLVRMQRLGADIPKIAVMPKCKKDVLTLLAATEEMASQYADRPIITMSMAADGVISRLCGEVFGSALTFGAVGKTSAPGQMEAGALKTVLDLLHKSL
ncbi:MAG: type I 3-dehydroquinate dehydratase [Faecalicatena sp.]|uniref:type I 3-dehydroquinate dehydratase n=1 Tax=Faecalicatena sp. TaxID=2005360 RepID=UPI00258F0167|nr:type I 3-dehydroquinate dehydratase [Faecalicatena sp.]MCI6467822.1 type I 3-dehydroquinate dehydratase [Faecalicatena sp.]MDY5619536.1 type I 3-dehydroquinate dehydratase [Lachnospiraceae bacterium]